MQHSYDDLEHTEVDVVDTEEDDPRQLAAQTPRGRAELDQVRDDLPPRN